MMQIASIARTALNSLITSPFGRTRSSGAHRESLFLLLQYSSKPRAAFLRSRLSRFGSLLRYLLHITGDATFLADHQDYGS